MTRLHSRKEGADCRASEWPPHQQVRHPRLSSTLAKETVTDVSEITQAHLEAEVKLKKAREARRPADVATLERPLSDVERKLDQLLKEHEKQPSP